MKNAKLSTRAYKRKTGYTHSAEEVSQLEHDFFQSIVNDYIRAEIRFNMQREWRELFSNFCVDIGQPINADLWLASVVEMDRRAALVKEQARNARRKLMMGYALKHDMEHSDPGIFIEGAHNTPPLAPKAANPETDDIMSFIMDHSIFPDNSDERTSSASSHNKKTSPFLSKVMDLLNTMNIPFDHADVWAPTLIQNDNSQAFGKNTHGIRLSHAGYCLSEKKNISNEDYHNLAEFAEYSTKFSFNVGCGLPGRVYQSGIPTWEQNIQNAPAQHFERLGGALQWGIKTVVGLPISSPTVGRVVLNLYSTEDVNKDHVLVNTLSEEIMKVDCFSFKNSRFL